MAVRHAVQNDLADAAGVLAQAFFADPWFRWLYPDDLTRLDYSSAWFHLVLSRTIGKGHTYVCADGAVNWIPPDVHFPEAADIDQAITLLTSQIGDRAMQALGVIGQAGACFPDEPRFHCVYVGVHPRRQGQGNGRALLGRVLAACDSDGLAASLSSTNDANLDLYRSLGFAEIGQVEIPGAGQFLRPMWRPRRD